MRVRITRLSSIFSNTEATNYQTYPDLPNISNVPNSLAQDDLRLSQYRHDDAFSLLYWQYLYRFESSCFYVCSQRARDLDLNILLAARVMTGTPSTSTADHLVFLSPPGTLGETRKRFVEYGFE